MEVKTNLTNFLSIIPENVKLVAVSKTKPVDLILEAYDAGQRIFGENKVQDLVQKQPLLPGDIQWHFIGHLQTNKVKQIAPFISLIHGIDSLKLLKEVNKQAEKVNRKIDCLLQFHIANEESKYGLSTEEADDILKGSEFSEMEHIRIIGVMGMATFTDDTAQIIGEFKKLKNIFEKLKKEYFSDYSYFNEISMGMSGDYKLAILEGSTMIRIGTAIFGERNYHN